MSTFNAANRYETTLTAAINNIQTSFDVDSVTGRPSVPFKVSLGTEIMDVTAVTGLTFTVVRGAESSPPANHLLGTRVENLWTAGTMVSMMASLRRQSFMLGLIL